MSPPHMTCGIHVMCVKAKKHKQIKYLGLALKAVNMWDIDLEFIVPIVMLDNGLISKNRDRHLERLALD